MGGRIEWIDKAKAIAIFFVLFGHVVRVEVVYTYISHMIPFFFFITGLLISERRLGCDFVDYLRAKARSRLTPYLFFGAVTYGVWFAWSLRDIYFRNEPHDLVRPLIGMIYGIGTMEWLPHNVPLWFLPCLFVSDVYFYMAYKVAGRSWAMIVVLFSLSCIGYALDVLCAWRLPWSADSALTAVLFMGAGFLSRDKIVRMRLRFGEALLLLLGGAVLALSNCEANLNYNEFGNILIFWSASACGIIGWIEIAKRLPDAQFVANIGKSTLSLFALQGVSIMIITLSLKYGFGIDVNSLHSAPAASIVTALVFAFLSVVIILPLDRFLMKRMPTMLGMQPRERERKMAPAPLIEDQVVLTPH